MADTIPTEPTAAQNAGNVQEAANEITIDKPNENAAGPKKISFTQEELDKKFAERQARAEKAAEKKFQKQIDDLNLKIQEYESKGLSDAEKVLKDYEKANGRVKELEGSLNGVQLENAKLKALIKAGALPDQLDGLLKRVAGSNEEEIITDVEELKTFGWIGKKDEITTTKLTGLGSPTKTGEPATKVTLRDQLREVNSKLSDPKLPHREKEALMKESIKLNRKIITGET